MNNNISNINKPKIQISFKDVKFGKTNKQPLKGAYTFKGGKHLSKIHSLKFSIVSAEQQKKDRNPNYHFFSID